MKFIKEGKKKGLPVIEVDEGGISERIILLNGSTKKSDAKPEWSAVFQMAMPL